MKTNKNGVKLLAIVMAFAMVFVGGFVIISSSEDADAAATEVNTASGLRTAASADNADVKLTDNIVLDENLTLGANAIIDLNGKTITTNGKNIIGASGDTITSKIVGVVGKNSVTLGAGTISNVIFDNYRNAIKLSGTGNHIIDNCKFLGCDTAVADKNTQGHNAAIYGDVGANVTLTVRNCTFTGYYYEGAISTEMESSTGVLNLSNNTGIDKLNLYGPSNGDQVPITIGTNLIVADTEINAINMAKNGTGPAPKIVVPSGQSLTAGSITGHADSSVQVQEGGSVDAAISVTYSDSNPRTAIGSTILALEGDLIIVGDAYITDNLTIPEGKNVIVRNGGTLDLNNKTLTIIGSLIVENGGIVKDLGSGSIILTRNGTLDNSGIIGNGEVAVTVSADVGDSQTYRGVGSVTMRNASGVTFGIVATGENSTDGTPKPVYVLTVTGDIISTGTGSSAVTVNGARIVGEMTIGQEVTLNTTKVSLTNVAERNVDVMPKAVLTINGTLGTTDNNSLVMQNNSTIIINGKAIGSIRAITNEYAANSTVVTNKYSDIGLYGAGNYYVTGVTLEVTQSNYTNTRGNLMIKQILEISGTTDLVPKTTPATGTVAGSISITSTAGAIPTIPEGAKLILDEGVGFDGNVGATVATTVYGQILYPYATTNAPTVSGFVGTKYLIVDATDSTKKTVYIEPFASAIKQIDSADNKTVTVSGALTIKEGFTLADKQRIVLSSSNDAIIGENATVVLEKGSSISNKFATANGVLIINTGASCNAPTNYQVMKKTTDYIQYSGLAVALKTATTGDEITIAANATPIDLDKKGLTVPSGITLITNRAITTEKEIVVEKDAKLVIKGGVTVTSEYKDVTVDGILDASEGALAVSDTGSAGSKLISKGETILTATNFSGLGATKIQGFLYTNESGNKVITTLANAVAKASIQDINNTTVTAYGAVTETDAITLDKVSLVLADGAKVTLGEVTLKGRNITASASGAELNATVIGLDGDGDAAADGTVKVTKYNAIIAQSPETLGTGVIREKLTIGAVKNTIEIVSGSARLAADYTVSDGTSTEKTKLIVDKDAILLSENSSASFSGTYIDVKVDGTLKVTANMGISGVNTFEVSGKMEIVGATVTVSSTGGKISVLGDILITKNAAGTEGALAVQNSNVTVGKALKTTGSTGTITGKVLFNDASNSAQHFIIAYAGSDLSEIVVDPADGKSTAKTTIYFVNGVEYATVYAKSSNTVTVNGAINAETGLSIDGYTIPSGNTWKDVDGTEATDKKIGEVASVSTQLTPGTANIVYSAGTGISLWVDNVKVNSSTQSVPILLGTHTVVAKVDPGYKGDVTITFNGQKVTDGKILITADMTLDGAANVVLSASGDITIDSGVTPSPEPTPVEPTKDDSLGITEYLLIVLVVLAAILVVVVAIRMMRS